MMTSLLRNSNFRTGVLGIIPVNTSTQLALNSIHPFIEVLQCLLDFSNNINEVVHLHTILSNVMSELVTIQNILRNDNCGINYNLSKNNLLRSIQQLELYSMIKLGKSYYENDFVDLESSSLSIHYTKSYRYFGLTTLHEDSLNFMKELAKFYLLKKYNDIKINIKLIQKIEVHLKALVNCQTQKADLDREDPELETEIENLKNLYKLSLEEEEKMVRKKEYMNYIKKLNNCENCNGQILKDFYQRFKKGMNNSEYTYLVQKKERFSELLNIILNQLKNFNFDEFLNSVSTLSFRTDGLILYTLNTFKEKIELKGNKLQLVIEDKPSSFLFFGGESERSMIERTNRNYLEFRRIKGLKSQINKETNPRLLNFTLFNLKNE